MGIKKTGKRKRLQAKSSARDLGTMGEGELQKWAGQVGIVANLARKDKAGWDYLLQFSTAVPVKPVSSLDQVPPSNACLLQVKATDSLKRRQVKLDNWERFVNPFLPAFFLVLDFNSNDNPEAAFLVHMDEHWIGRLIKALRELPAKEKGRLHKHSMTLAWTEAERLPELNGRALKAAMERHIGPNILKYAENKRKWIESVGFNGARHRGTLVTIAQNDSHAQDILVDFALGISPDLPSVLKTLEEVRFDIAKPVRQDLPQDVIMRLPELKPTATVTLLFSSEHTGRRARIRAGFYNPRSIFPFIDDDHLRLRFASELVEVLIRQKPPQIDFSFHLIGDESERPLDLIANVAELLLMVKDSQEDQGQGITLSVLVDGKEAGVYQYRNPRGFEISPQMRELAEVAANAGFIARFLNLPPELLVTVASLLGWRDQIMACRVVLDTNREQIVVRGETNADAPEDTEYGFSFVCGMFFGTTLVMLGVALHGRAAFGPSATGEVGRKSIIVKAPSADIVTRLVIPNAHKSSHPAAPIHEKVYEWLERRGIAVIANADEADEPQGEK